MIRKIAYGLMSLSFVLIISGGVSSFLLGLQQDRQQTYKRIEVVNDNFKVFNDNTTAFENARDELYKDVLANVYYDTMAETDAAVKTKLSNYENLVDELEKNAKSLEKLCDEVYYPDSEANSKCNNYKIIYEQVVNYFVSDISVYNKNVKSYNAYQKSLNSTITIKEYETNKKYIDYNQDKKYDGKEE